MEQEIMNYKPFESMLPGKYKDKPVVHFYPTIPIAHEELQEANSRAISQEVILFLWMETHGGEFTAWDLKRNFQYEITSIRRALFNLEKQGKIVQRGFCPGPKGKPVSKFIAFTGKLF